MKASRVLLLLRWGDVRTAVLQPSAQRISARCTLKTCLHQTGTALHDVCIYSESCVSGALPRLLAGKKPPCRFTRSIALYREVIKEVDYSQQPSLISTPLGERWLKHADYKFSGEAYSKTRSINFFRSN